MVASLLRYLAFAALLCTGSGCLAQAVTIRLVNVANQLPLPRQQVTVLLFYTREDRPANYEEDLSFTTDASGEARFILPEPAPEHLFVEVPLPDSKWWCVCSSLSDTQEVMRTGTVELPRGEDHGTALSAKPGEIVISARKLPFWKRLLYRFKD